MTTRERLSHKKPTLLTSAMKMTIRSNTINMNRTMLFIAMVVCAVNANAQLGIPVNSQKDTFFIQRVLYNGTELNVADWPSPFIVEDAVNIYVAQFTYEKGRMVYSAFDGYGDCNGHTPHLVRYDYRARCNGTMHNVSVVKSEDGKYDCSRKYTIGDYVFDVYGSSAEMKKSPSVEIEEVYQVVEIDPMFPGGIEAMYEFLAQNIRYPQSARENNISGRVFLTFVVMADGSLANVRVIRGIGGGCDEEAVRVVKSMPKWIPGKSRGKAVNVQYNLPVNFSLR